MRFVRDYNTRCLGSSPLRPSEVLLLEVDAGGYEEASSSARRGDLAECVAIDARVGGSEVWTIQHVDCIHSELELCPFRDHEPLDQVHVQPQG